MVEAIFQNLHLPTRAEVLWEHGMIVSERTIESGIVTLYRLYAFYVEVHCNLEFNVIEDITVVSRDELRRHYKHMHYENNE